MKNAGVRQPQCERKRDVSTRELVRVGVVGTGVGLRTLLPAFRATNGAEVVALAGSNSERTKEFAEAHGIARAMDCVSLCRSADIDLVCIATPNPFHREGVIAALREGKHVLCEKPLAMNMEETCELITIASAHPGQLTLVNHQLRFNPYLRKVKALIDTGAIGRPYFLRIHQQSTGFAKRQVPWSWVFDPTMGGGVRLAMASHLVDLVHAWFGETIASVTGTLDPVIRERLDLSGATMKIGVSGFFGAALELETGLAAHLSATAASCGVGGFEVSIYGEDGELHFNLCEKLKGAFRGKEGEVKVIDVEGVTTAERANRVSFFAGSFVYFAAEIVRAIRTGDRSGLATAATFRDERSVQNVLDALARSANLGTIERINTGKTMAVV